MSCKVIRWFKRQASLRKNSEKSDEKTQGSQNNSDEKKKTGFPRLSFRRRHKKKTESAFEPQGTRAIVGISKQFSFSLPQEMESHTTKESLKNGMPTSTSMGFGSVSLTSSPTKSEGDKSTTSELSDHSSFDCSKDSSNSPTTPEKELEVNKEDKVTPDISKASNCDNYQTFHSLINSVNSIAIDQSGSLLREDCSASNTEAATIGAPIVRMEEICGNVSYTTHPEEIRKSPVTDDTVMTLEKPSSPSGSEVEVMGTNQVEEECVNIIRNGHEMPIKEKDHSIKSESDVAIADTLTESSILSPDPNEYNVFEEIERLVNDTICLVEEETNFGEHQTKQKRSENDNGRVGVSEGQTNEGSSLVRSTDLSEQTLNGGFVIKNTSDCGEEVPAISNDLACETTNIELEDEKYNDEDAMPQLNVKEAQNHSETMANEDDINSPDDCLELKYSNTHMLLNEDLKPETSVERENEIEKQSSNICPNNSPQTIVNYYPMDLNPFGDDDDSDDETAENRLSKSNVKYNKRVTQNLENGGHNNKENYGNPFEEEANVKRKSTNISSHVNRRFVNSKHSNTDNEPFLITGTSTKSLNPFGDSDDEDSSPLKETRRTETEEKTLHIPPQLPPKSVDRQNRRKNSQGSLAPIPHPRRSKPSHYGSYTSLQNMPTVPVPAPRSFTPSGSTRTLYESTNPFGDDCEDEGASFERRGLGRSTFQSGSSSCVPESFVRSAATGSLPPALRIRMGKKKRKAPLPPKSSSHNKSLANSCGPEEVTAFPRARSSTSPESDGSRFNKKPPTGRAVSPLPPPRPPPPNSAKPPE